MTTLKDLKKKQRIIDNIQKLDVHTHYEKLDEFMLLNPNLTSSQYVKNIDFHPFTVESFEYILNQINKCRVTWFDIGPFIKNKDGTWYNKKSKKIQTIENLVKENIELRGKNKDLSNQNSNLITMLEKSKQNL